MTEQPPYGSEPPRPPEGHPSDGPTWYGSHGPSGPWDRPETSETYGPAATHAGHPSPTGEPTAQYPVYPPHPTHPAYPALATHRRQPRGRMRRAPIIAGGAAALLLLGVGGYAIDQALDGARTPEAQGTVAQQWTAGPPLVQQANASAPDWTATAAAVSPSVVSITVSRDAQGSGVVIDSAGHIITNNHVVAGGGSGAAQIVVTLADKRAYAAKVVGTDPTADLAVLQLTDPPADLRPATMGDADGLKVGSPVMAVGNPLGLAGTVTTGIVSALNRPVQTTQQSDNAMSNEGQVVVTNAIQTSAAINPGNSGGALVNASGQLVGINSSIAQTSQDGGNIGIGFAIPVNEARSVADQILRTGAVKHAYLGAEGDDGLVKEGSAQRAAAVISRIAPNSPAQQAGMRAGDAVVAVDGEIVDSWLSLVAQVRERDVNEAVTLTTVRGGKRHDVKVTLAERPAG